MYQEERSSSDSTTNAENMDGICETACVVDLRSDTLTKPTKRMREAMRVAEVGDDVYGEDPTVKKLESKAAEMVGMEAAIYVPSGTMSNLIAIMVHCNARGCEAYCVDSAHCLVNEQCGAAQLGGVQLTPVRSAADGTFDLRDLEAKIRKGREYEPISRLVLVENTINGKIVPQKWLNELVMFCKKANMKSHMDGARLWNASVGSGIPAKQIVSGFDSVSFCLSKGLGAPVGSLLCGSKEFVQAARRVRKALGGGMRQVGILAMAGLVALEDTIPILSEDHRKARVLASSIKEADSVVFTVNSKTVQTNMVFVEVDSHVVTAAEFVGRLGEIRDDDDNDTIIVKCSAVNNSLVRFVLYFDITDSQLLLAIRKIRYVIKQLDPDLNTEP